MKNNKKKDTDIELAKLKLINDNISKCVNRYFRIKIKKNIRTFTGINVDKFNLFNIYKQKNVKI
tara:strand:+ start:13974 stop:14165 length:192 start_codon:yes stop_codon:yes gene_type:complete